MRPLGVALAVVGAAVLLVVGMLAGAALTASRAGSAAAPAEGSVDAGFARDMQAHHGQAVEMSILVRERSEDPRLRQVALDVLLTQQQQQGQMFGWLATWGLPPSSSLPVMGWMGDEPFGDATGMAGMDMGEPTAGPDDQAPAGNPMYAMGLATPEQMARLEAADGVEAERIYLQLMIPHHLGGIEMASYAVEHASQPQVRRLAESMSNAQTAELTVLQDLLDARGGPVDL